MNSSHSSLKLDCLYSDNNCIASIFYGLSLYLILLSNSHETASDGSTGKEIFDFEQGVGKGVILGSTFLGVGSPIKSLVCSWNLSNYLYGFPVDAHFLLRFLLVNFMG